MTPAARIAAAIEVLDQVLIGNAAEKALLSWSRRSRFAGSKDRAAVRDIVFQSLRCRRSYAAMGGALTGRGLVRGYLAEASMDETEVFGASRHAPPVQDDVQLTPWSKLPAADRADLQDWVWDMLQDDLGEHATQIAGALRAQAPIWLRINAQKADFAHLSRVLEEEGHAVFADPELATAMRVARPARGLANTKAAQSGLFEFQDISSQRAIAALGDLSGLRVLDYCAGGGGKALAMAAAGADVTAHDSDPRRMKDLDQRAQRAGAAIKKATAAELRHESFDLVLCDVPCSGSGAWRRVIDSKWSLTPQKLDDLVALQRGIVQSARSYLRPGGRFAYMTCSLFSLENSAQAGWIEDALGMPCSAQRQMTPRDGGDGFFVSTFQG